MLIQPEPGFASKVMKSYAATLGKFSATGQYIRGMDVLGNDLLVLKYHDNYPPEIIDKLRDFAAEIASHFGEGLTVVLCPRTINLQQMDRCDAVQWIRELAATIGCEVIDPKALIEPYIFPNLSAEKLEELRQAVKDSPPATIRVMEEDPFYQQGRKLAATLNDRVSDAMTRAIEKK